MTRLTALLALILTVALALPALAAPGMLLFEDDFEVQDLPLSQWSTIDLPGSKPPSHWRIGGGQLVQLADTASGNPSNSGTLAIAGDSAWTDYAFGVKLMSEDNDGIGVLFRYTDADNYYLFRWSGAGTNWNGKVLEKCSGGEFTELARDTSGYSGSREYWVGVQVSGGRIRLYIDDPQKPVFDVVDEDPLTAGKIGLYSWDNAGSTFRQVRVATLDYPFPAPANLLPPLAVSGTVFDDANANGTRDSGEKGLSGVAVSDGVAVVLTGADGSYLIQDSDRERSKFVFVTVPSGRRCTDFYHRLPLEGERFAADFPLQRSDDSAQASFTFAQVTDIHVTGDYDPMLEDLTEIAGLGADFVVATGDLVNDARLIEQVETYKAGITRSPVTVMSLPGNHDGGGDPTNYESLLGPDYYSFDYGGCHFVMYNSADTNEAQQLWLESDLAAAAGKPVLFFQHYHPSGELMELLAGYNTLGIFTGHWHTTRVFPYKPKAADAVADSILYVNTPPPSFGGIDASPRGFVLGHIDNGKLRLEHRHGGVKQKLQIVSPAEGSEVAAGRVDVQITAYDSSSRAARVSYHVDSRPWKPAKQSGVMTWTGHDQLSPGEHTLTVQCSFGDAPPVKNVTKFSVTADAAPAVRLGSDWPTLQGDVVRSGIAHDVVQPPMRLAWSRMLGGTAHHSAPVVADGMVYVGLADEDCSGKAGVYALDARTGEVRWVHPTRGSVRNSPAVAGGSVYAISVAGEVVALDATTGDLRFEHSLNPVLRWLFSSPAVDGSTLYAGSGAEFVALDSRTGERIWTAERMGSDWISCNTSPAVSRGKVLMGLNWTNGLYALDRRTGKIIWNSRDGYRTTHATPTIVDGRVYHAADAKLHCADAIDGKDIWTLELPGGWTLSSPVVSGGKVFVGGPDGYMYCVDAESGQKIWTRGTGESILCFTPYGRDRNPFIASPVVSGDTVYCGSGDGRLYAYSASSGEVLWQYDLGVPITSSVAVSGNTVYVTTFDGAVHAFVGAGS